MSRIDGTSNVAEIAEETGKPIEEVHELLERLVLLGVLALEEPPVSQERRHSPAAAQPSGAFRIGPIIETRSGSNAEHPAAALYDPAELEEAVDIDLPRRRRILDLYYGLDHLSHYQLFGVDPSVDKKAIKAAYFEVVNVFHPDRYFGKNVGSFKPKLEKVFARLTESYEVLSRAASRAEYDAYLRAQSKTRAFDAGQVDNPTHQVALQEVMRRIQAEALAGSPAPGTPQTSGSMPAAAADQPSPESIRRAPSTSPRPSVSPELRPSSSLRPSDPDLRKRALARKLGRASQPTGASAGANASSTAQQEAEREAQALESARRGEWAGDELKRRYQDRLEAARGRQLDVYRRAAQVALEKNDSVGAANALRIAVSLAPTDEALKKQLNEVAGKAAQELAASYLQQAEYEERDEKWLAAAKSYSRALQGRTEAKLLDKVAHCLLTGEGNLREAGEMAKKAVLLAPEEARFRVTLARFYVKAGMKQSAEGELSRAATLGSSDDKVVDWIRRLKRELG